MVIDLHAKNQLNICKHLGKTSGKLILQTDRQTDRLMDGLTDVQTANPKSPLALPLWD